MVHDGKSFETLATSQWFRGVVDSKEKEEEFGWYEEKKTEEKSKCNY